MGATKQSKPSRAQAEPKAAGGPSPVGRTSSEPSKRLAKPIAERVGTRAGKAKAARQEDSVSKASSPEPEKVKAAGRPKKAVDDAPAVSTTKGTVSGPKKPATKKVEGEVKPSPVVKKGPAAAEPVPGLIAEKTKKKTKPKEVALTPVEAKVGSKTPSRGDGPAVKISTTVTDSKKGAAPTQRKARKATPDPRPPRELAGAKSEPAAMALKVTAIVPAKSAPAKGAKLPHPQPPLPRSAHTSEGGRGGSGKVAQAVASPVRKPRKKKTEELPHPQPPLPRPARTSGGGRGGSGTKTPLAPKRKPRKKPEHAVLYIARGGSARGVADYEVPFPTRPQALAFLANQHGLTTEEVRKLAKGSSLRLKRQWHGSEACAVREIRMTPDEAQRALFGELSRAS